MSTFLQRALILVFFFTLSSSGLVAQQTWARFHGANGSGVSMDSTLPSSWTDSDYVWQVDLLGVGSGSPVIWGDRIFLTSSDPQTAELTVLCLSTDDGQQLWQKKFESSKYHHHRKNNFASSTLAADQQQIYVAYANEQHTWLVALSHEGEEKWKRDFGPYFSSHGFSSSPIVYQDKVILVNSQQAEKLKPGQQPGVAESFRSALPMAVMFGRPLWKQRACATAYLAFTGPPTETTS